MTLTVSGLLAGMAAGVGVWLWRARPVVLPARLDASRSRTGVGLVLVGLVVGLLVTVLHGAHLVLALVAAAVAGALGREVRRRRRAAAADRRADLVLATCEGLASDLRAGQPPVSALEAAALEWPDLGPVAAAARLGADVPRAFRDLARQPGAGQLRVVGAAWQVAHRSGAGLASALETAAEEVRAARATARVVATEMAAAQATARLLVVLPVAVLLLGSGLGGDPLGFLLRSSPGLVCLCVGLALEYAGLSWLAAIADRVTGRS
jgi:tight adherence protein B